MNTLHGLKVRIQEAKFPAAGQSLRKFLPEGCLLSILKLDDVVLALGDPIFEVPEYKRESTAKIVLGEGTKTFAILLELNQEYLLKPLIEHDLLDSALPFQEGFLSSLAPHVVAHSNFTTVQWDYLAYRSRKGQYHRTISDKQTLPYIEQENIGGGGFSKVYRVLVHSAHQDVIQNTSQKVSFSCAVL